MRATFDIALNELRILFGDPSIWINLVIIPIVLSVAIGLATGAVGGSSEVQLRVDVLDNDNSTFSQQFLADIRSANSNIVLCPADSGDEDRCGLGESAFTPELAQTRLEQEDSLALIEIPAGFSESLSTGENSTIRYRSNEDATAPSYILQAVQAAAQKLGGAQAAVAVADAITSDMAYLQFSDEADQTAFSEGVRAEAQSLWSNDPVRVEFVQATIDEESDSTGGFKQSIPGMASMYVMFNVLPAAAAFIRERKEWTLQRLVTMPVSRSQILAGKLLARFVIGMIQYGVLFGFGLLIGVRFGSDLPAILLLMISFTLCVTALALALTTILKNESQASGITLFISLTLAPLGGAWWSLDIVPALMRTIGHISPIAWVMDGFQSLFFFNGGLGNVLLPAGVLLAMAAAFFAFGVARFRFD